MHASGDLESAAAGYATVLSAQPRFAPAHHLAGVVAGARERKPDAAQAFAAAIAAEPRFVDARIAAAEVAVAEFELDRALALVEDGLALDPRNVSLLRMRGRILLRRRDGVQAERAFRELLMLVPADADAHFRHGVALQRMGDAASAARAYQRALTLRPDLIDADFNLGVAVRAAGQPARGGVAPMRTCWRSILGTSRRTSTSASSCSRPARSIAGSPTSTRSRRIARQRCSLAVYALEACQHEGDFTRVERYLDGLRRDEFHAENEDELADCLESLLYLLLFFDVEPSLVLRLSQAYDALAPQGVRPAHRARPRRASRGALRVGYLSGDLRNHVMGKMMWQAIAHHDRERFELFFYSTSAQRDEWTQRFEGVAHAFRRRRGMDDATAASRIAADDLDLLVDLSTHTQGLATRHPRAQSPRACSSRTSRAPARSACRRSIGSSPTATPTCPRARNS